MRRAFLLLMLYGLRFDLNAQVLDSLQTIKSHSKTTAVFTPKSVAFPTACIGYGISSLYSNRLKVWNNQTNNQIAVKNPNNKVHIDDYLVYSPALLTFSLEAAGVKAKHDWKEGLLLYAITNAVVTTVVIPVKYVTKENRPDESSLHSFPSGHTSMAFASAEFARMEYRDHPWVGVLGYSMATATGYLRMYNNRHWLGDVVAGAGVGILSAKFSYWIIEKSKKALFSRKVSENKTQF